MTAKEALASFFSSVADHFLDMAAQIIAKMIQMFILQQALKIFGGGFRWRWRLRRRWGRIRRQ
jgi:hypothetical protein